MQVVCQRQGRALSLGSELLIAGVLISSLPRARVDFYGAAPGLNVRARGSIVRRREAQASVEVDGRARGFFLSRFGWFQRAGF